MASSPPPQVLLGLPNVWTAPQQFTNGGAVSGTFTGPAAFSGQISFTKPSGTGIAVTAGATIGGALTVAGAAATGLLTTNVAGVASLAVNMPASFAKFGWVGIDANGGGTITWGPSTRPVAGTIPFSVAANVTGTTDAAVGTATQWNFNIASDTLNSVASSSGFAGILVNQIVGGGSTAGGHTAMLINVTHTGVVAASVPTFLGVLNLNYTGNSNFTGSEGGSGVVFNPQIILTNISSSYSLIEVIEGGIQNFGSSALITRGWLGMFSGGTGGNAQAVNDYALGILRVKGEVGFKAGILLGRTEAPFGIDAAGSVIGLNVQTNGSGNGWINPLLGSVVNLPQVAFNGPAWWTSGLQLINSGLRAGPGSIVGSSTALTIDVGTAKAGAYSSVNVGGSAYAAGDHLSDNLGGIWNADTVIGGTITALSVVRRPWTYDGSTPSPLSLTGGSDTNQTARVNVSWTVPTALNFGTSGAITIGIGNASSTTTLLGSAQFGAGGSSLGFYGTSPIAKQTGVAVTAAGIHAALTSLGMIAP